MKGTSASNASIERMFKIIEIMSVSGKAMRLNEIGELSGVSASTAMRILNALIENGYAKQDEETLLYSLTMKFLMLGTNIRENLSFNQVFHPYLVAITKRLSLSCALGILDNDMLVYIDESVSAKQMVRIFHHLGHAFPLHYNASGKLFLSRYSDKDLETYCKKVTFEPPTLKGVSSEAELKKQLAQVAVNGYAVNDEENTLGMRCFAVPLLNADGQIIASVSVTGTIFQMPIEQIPSMSEAVKKILDGFYEDYGPLLKLDNIFRL